MTFICFDYLTASFCVAVSLKIYILLCCCIAVPSRSYRAGLNQHSKCFLAAKEAKGPWQSFPWHCFQVLWASPLCVYRVPGQVSNQPEFWGLFASGRVGLYWILYSSCRELIYWNSAAWFRQEQWLWFEKLWVGHLLGQNECSEGCGGWFCV